VNGALESTVRKSEEFREKMENDILLFLFMEDHRITLW
jgi:hypothetical protein